MQKGTLLLGIGIGLTIAFLALSGTPEHQTQAVTTYQNDEKLELTRGDDGYLTSVHVKRDAKTGG